jgi:DNA-binding response OmpR family regulator
VRPGTSSERAIILAPTGRDASVAAALIKEAGYHANICSDLGALLGEIETGAGLAVIADEAIKTADLRGLMGWLNDQPSWSDFPLVLLTHQGGGPERNPDAARLGRVLGNVTFIERPFHPTTLVSIIGSAVRGRRRQYATRAILADLTESEGLLQTALDGGHLGALELHLPEFELEASDTCKGFFGRKPGEPFSYQDLLAAVYPEDRARRLELLDLAIATGGDYSVEYRNSGRTDRSIGSRSARGRSADPTAASNHWSAFHPTSPRARSPKSIARRCCRSWRPSEPRLPS